MFRYLYIIPRDSRNNKIDMSANFDKAEVFVLGEQNTCSTKYLVSNVKDYIFKTLYQINSLKSCFTLHSHEKGSKWQCQVF